MLSKKLDKLWCERAIFGRVGNRCCGIWISRPPPPPIKSLLPIFTLAVPPPLPLYLLNWPNLVFGRKRCEMKLKQKQFFDFFSLNKIFISSLWDLIIFKIKSLAVYETCDVLLFKNDVWTKIWIRFSHHFRYILLIYIYIYISNHHSSSYLSFVII